MLSLRQSYDLLLVNLESALQETMPTVVRMEMFSRFSWKKVVSTVDEFFVTLTSNANFFDYSLVEKAIKFFLKHEHPVSFELSDYVKKLDNFKTSKTVQEFLKGILHCHSMLSTGESIIFRLGFNVNRDDVEQLLLELFQDNSSILTRLKIRHYSLQGEMKLEYYCINFFL